MTEQTITTNQVTSLRIVARNNYSLKSEQFIITESKENPTLVDVAIFLDITSVENIERRAYSGLGAGARLELIFNGDNPDSDDTIGEEIFSLESDMLTKLENGSIQKLREHIHHCRTHTVWNGHNYIPQPCDQSEELLSRLRNS
jgi:hypothetical protein